MPASLKVGRSVAKPIGASKASSALSAPPSAGVTDGQRIRLAARGHAGERGGPNGDLCVVVRVREDERFLRDGEDLVTVIDVPAPMAALGTTVQVPTFDGDVPLEIPAGTQPGETIVMRGRGLPPLSRGRTGDLRVVVNVAIPRRLTREQRTMLQDFAATVTEDNLRSDEGKYWTGYVYPDDVNWPVEHTTYTAAAVVLAVDTLSMTTPGSDIFRGSSLPTGFPEIGLECGCETADSPQRVS